VFIVFGKIVRNRNLVHNEKKSCLENKILKKPEAGTKHSEMNFKRFSELKKIRKMRK